MINIFQKNPNYKSHSESWVKKKLDIQYKSNLDYSFHTYADLFWATKKGSNADITDIKKNKIKKPIFVGYSIEELYFLIDIYYKFKNVSFKNLIKTLFTLPEQLEEPLKNCFILKDEYRKKLIEIYPHSPRLKSFDLDKKDIFQHKSNLPVMILSPAPAMSCNYRCEYCFNHDYGFNKNEDDMFSWSKNLIKAVQKIKCPLYLSVGSSGEPLFQKIWLDTINKVYEYKNVLNVAFVTNLSADPRDKIKNIDNNRTGILATLHPTQFKNYDTDLKNFFNRVLSIKKDGIDIAVNYVLIPEQINQFHEIKSYLDKHNIDMTCNLLRGPYKGKMFPKSYTNEELSLAKKCQEQLPFIWKYQSQLDSPYGIRCLAGRLGFQLDFNGDVYNCVYSRQKMGNINNNKLFLYSENCFCDASKCESQVMISMMKNVYKKNLLKKNMHTFAKRKKEGEHPVIE